jgi:phosphoserine phosphatase
MKGGAMNQQTKMISLSAIGLYTPGLVAKITTRIFELGGNILDVEENCRRGLFSIFLIVDFSAAEWPVDEIIGRLMMVERETGLKVILDSLDRYESEDMAIPAKRENHQVTIIGVDQPGIIAKISSLFHRYNVTIENCRMIARGKLFSMEMIINTGEMKEVEGTAHSESIDHMKRDLKTLCASIDQSVVIQSGDIFKKQQKLVVFDVESSLIQQVSLKNFIAGIKGAGAFEDNQLSAVDEPGDQLQTIIENARYLKGIPIADLQRISDILELNPGTIELIKILKSMGFKIALLSTGFSFFIKKIFETAGIDYAFANTLDVDDKGITTGELQEPVITSDTKENLMEFILESEKIDRDQVIAVGNGSRTSHFIENVGLSIAFKPDKWNMNTDGVLSQDQILNILYCLGIPNPDNE